MKHMAGGVIVACGCLALAAWPAVPAARGCAVAMPEGKHVHVATESAVIVWDEKTKTQHFIRRASFETKLPYFGFLVPTPTRPKLAEAPDELFERLEGWTAPEVKQRVVYRDWIERIGCAGGSVKTAGGVEVLERQRVAGYDAAVLRASDGEALRGWLEKHGYDARPQLTAWLEPYIQAGWVITAFQVPKKDADEQQLSTQAVRMSFTTERPFFPYREPADAREEEPYRRRLLRLFVIAGGRMKGALDDPKTAWPGKAVWADALSGERREELGRHLGAGVGVPEGAWLTVFDDRSSPRPGVADLSFTPTESVPLHRPPVYEERVIEGPGVCAFACVLFLVAPFVVWWGVVRLTRRRAAAGGK